VTKREKALAAFAAGAFFLCVLTLCVDAHDRITTRVTWDREIAPIFDARCVDCHRPGGRSTIPLASYQQARPWAAAIKEEVLTRRMPKWHAVRGYGDFTNDPSLSPFEIATIVAWADGGAPKGTDQPATLANMQAAPPKTDAAPPVDRGLRKLTLACGDEPLPAGRIFGIEPQLDPKGSVGIAVRQPDGKREVVAWIRGFEPDFAATYWLRNPITTRRGSRLVATADSRCSVIVSFTESR